jgi:hypothetical protein
MRIRSMQRYAERQRRRGLERKGGRRDLDKWTHTWAFESIDHLGRQDLMNPFCPFRS